MENLFQYQLEGAEWLSKRKLALLADEMGLGKTAQAIRACELIEAKNVLVLCPAVGRTNWANEFLKFSKFPVSTQIFQKALELDISKNITICSYDPATIENLNNKAIKLGHRWGVMVLDECHFLKSTEAQRTKNVFGKEGIVRRVERVWAMSGTPAPNHAAELWLLLYMFKITPLKYEAFVQKFCDAYKNKFGLVIKGTKEKSIPELKELIKPIMLRRKKDQVLKDLPPITFGDVLVDEGEVNIYIDLGFYPYYEPVDRTKELQEKIEKERELANKLISEAQSDDQLIETLSSVTKSVATLRRWVGMQKLEALVSMIDDELRSKAYDKVVIFAVHRGVIEGLRQGLKEFGPVTIYGGTPEKKRENNIWRFQNEPKTRVFIGQIHAAGTSITLTAAHHVIFAEQDWVPGNNAQAAMRCHRIGQEKPVSVRFVGLANSLDQKIAGILRKKTLQLSQIFDEPGVAKN